MPFQGGSFWGLSPRHIHGVDRHGHFTLKQLRLPVLNETHTNIYTGPRLQGEGREGVETAIQVLGPSVMWASWGVRRSNCKQIWRRVYDPSEGMLKLLLYKILLV
jgi:hypothetical protein